jgi:hypothetical protein
MARYIVGTTEEIRPGQRKIVEIGGRAKGPYVAETYPVVVEQKYVIVDTGRRS